MIDGKEGVSKKNIIDFAFICVLAVSLIFVLGSVVANHINFWGSPNSTTLDFYRVTGIVVNEDAVNNFSILMNFTNTRGGVAYNITRINITLPAELIYINDTMSIGGNLTLNGTNLFMSINMNVTEDRKQLSWFNSSTDGLGAVADTVVVPLGTNATGDIGFNDSRIYFNFTGYEPGVYNMTVQIFYNGTDPLLSSNITYIQITVNDTTLPVAIPQNFSIRVGNTNYSNDTVRGQNFSGSIILNISVSDNGGVKGVMFNITNMTGPSGSNSSTVYYGTNSSTSPTYWNVTIDTSKFPDGENYTVWVWVNDSSNNLNATVWMGNFTIDNTAPTATMECTPASVNFYETVTCTCTTSDTNGINAGGTSFTVNPPTTSGGVHTEYCYFTDNAGNPGSASDTYEVLWGVSSSSGGSNGGTPSKSTVQIITAGTPKVMSGFASGTGVKQIEITTTSSVSNAEITVTKYDSAPSAVSSSKGGSYKYIKIDAPNLQNVMSKAIMTIQVEKTWVSQKGVAKEDVALFRYDETGKEWNELTTTYDSEDDSYYYYTVELGGFSYFSIAPKGVSDEQLPGDSEEEEQQPVGEGVSMWVWVIIGIIILAIIIGGGIVLKKKKR